jgi:translation initiation factor IF-3
MKKSGKRGKGNHNGQQVALFQLQGSWAAADFGLVWWKFSQRKPPVCKIMDYGRYRMNWPETTEQKKAKRFQIKEIKIRPKTGDHDLT